MNNIIFSLRDSENQQLISLIAAFKRFQKVNCYNKWTEYIAIINKYMKFLPLSFTLIQ